MNRMQFVDNFMTRYSEKFFMLLLSFSLSFSATLRRNMKFWIAVAIIAFAPGLVGLPSPAAHADDRAAGVFTGEIMDSLCAKEGSHDKMMDEMKSMGRDKQTCAQKCVQLG